MLHSWVTVYITLFFALLIVLIGTTCNAFLVFIIFKSPRLKGENHKLIATLGISDFLQSCNMVFMIVSLVNGGAWTLDEVVCKVNAFLITELLLASMLTICVISVNRYLKIVKPRVYCSVFNSKTISVIILLIWVLPLLFSVPPLLGWSDYAFKPSKCICLVESDDFNSYGIVLGCATLGINVPLIIFCYFNVFRAVGVHSTRMDCHRHQRCINVEEIRITQTLLIVIAAFLVCFLPITIVTLAQSFMSPGRIPAWIELITVMLAFTNQAIDPVIYGFCNTQYRRAMYRLTYKVFLNKLPSLTLSRGAATMNFGTTRTVQCRYSVGAALLVLFLTTEDELAGRRDFVRRNTIN
ncbi:predicted protein [Nematostella vectensis]|uniref:G-protein coupled receptors family 1 profile domain-containing protein n=1 Tax=Nematostella vectensis TaxID=45351 RepID=A7S7I1_NEMVE|nr:tyramine receptor Ser-2 [Nematostella vectensis]EDO40334.1 predicted protein [Nematostella vectensis]|eukprot:XP_001632397.1 predicted protein [Nematostella vectensis]